MLIDALEKFKFCPVCGCPSFRQDGKIKLICLECGFEHYVNPVTAVGIILMNLDNEVLLTKRGHEPGKDLYCVPGGFMDPGETAEGALSREIFEEIGLKLKGFDYFAALPNQYDFKGMIIHTTDIYFTKIIDRLQTIKMNEEVTSAEFMKLSEVDDSMLAFPSIKAAIQILKNAS